MGYFIVIILRNQRQKNDLYKAKILAEITTLENERTRIAHDLHDEMGPILSSVKLRANNLDIHSPEDKEELDKMNQNIDDMMQKMRAISNDLMPVILQRKGLVAAMKDSLLRIGRPNGLEIVFSYEDIPELPKNISIHLYRILQEVIHNTIKHARAKELKIEMTRKNGKLVVISEDNGTGFDYNNHITENSGLGLRSLLSRVEIMGGEMFIESKKGKGTQYIFEIPLP